MIRYAFSTLLALASATLPLLGASAAAAHSSAPVSSKMGSKSIPAPVPASGKVAQVDKTAKTAPTLTSDISRAAKSALVAAHQPAAPAPAPAPHATSTPHPESVSTLVSRVSPPASPTRNASASASLAATAPVRTTPTLDVSGAPSGERLARVTAYWRGEGDYYTGRCLASTGVRLHDGHCAVDPNIIPYGSVVDIKGVGKFLAVDTGSAVVSRTAAREGGQTSAERHAIVVDVFFADRSEGERFAAGAAKYVSISWWTPSQTGTEARAARSLFAEEDWTKIQGKQL